MKKRTKEEAQKALQEASERYRQREHAYYRVSDKYKEDSKKYTEQLAEWDRIEGIGKGVDEKTLNDELDRLTKEAEAKGYIWDSEQKRLSSLMGLSASDDYKDLEKQLIDVNNALDVKKRQKVYGITEDYWRVDGNGLDTDTTLQNLIGADEDAMKYYNRWLIHNGATSNADAEKEIERYIELEAAKRTMEMGRDYPVSAFFMTPLMNLASVAGVPLQFINGEKNPIAEEAKLLRQGATEGMSESGAFWYNLGGSAIESATAALIPGGWALLGASAASQTFNDIIDRGGTHADAFIGGLAAGAFESLFESVSISALKSMKPDEISASLKAFAKNMGKQVVTNAEEEAATELANILFDTITMGDISNASLMIERYMAQGMSESEAKRKVAGEFTSQILESAASGAVMGLGFGLVGAGVGAVRRSNEARGTVKDQRKLDDLIEAGEAVFTGAEYSRERELLDKIKAHKGSTNMSQRNRVAKLDRSIDKYTMEKVAPKASSLEEVQKAMSEEALGNVSQTLKNAREAASEVMIGKDVTYNSMPKIVEFDGDGGIVVQGKDGSNTLLSELSFEDDEIYEAYVLATTTGSVENANRFLEQYRLNSNSSTTDVENLWTAYMGGLSYGQTMTNDSALEEAVKRFASDTMPDTVIKSAFLSGRSLRESANNKYITLQKNYDKAWKEAGGKESVAKFDDSGLRGLRLDSSQQEYRSFLRTFSRAMGANIEVFASEKGARKENGSYNRDTNTIRIDINAGIGKNANYTAIKSCVVNTLSHETVHNMRVTAKEQYSSLRDYVLSVLQSDENYDLESAIEAEYEKARAKGRKDFTREDAIEEIVARACEDRLGSSEKLRDFMVEFYNKDKKAANSFVKAVREFLTRLKLFFENIAKQKSSSEEAQLIADQGKEIVAELQKRFDEAIMAMREGNIARNAVEAVNVSIDTATESASPIMLSEATWRESEYVTKEEEAAAALAKALDVSKADALKYIKNVNSVAKMIANDRARLDYVASSFGSAFVSNVEYGGSFDFTTLCKKRRVFTGTFQEIQKRLGEVALTPDQILEIRNLLIKAHLEAPCGLCYVEGSRANMGKFATEFIRLYKRDNPNAWTPKMVDVNTPDGVEQMRINHPEAYEQYEYFWNHYGKLKDSDPALFASQQKPKLYEARKAYANEILDRFTTDTGVDKKNRNGGIRMQSFSDFEIIHAIDTMQIIMDMSRVGLAGQAYTKVPEFAKAFGDTGLKINLSLIAKGVDENGRIIFDDREGMPHETAFDIRKKHSKNVGTILVIFNDKQLYAAMADDRIDFIIPFHRSQWKKGQYSAMGLPEGTKDYTYMQNEKLIKPTYHEYHGRMVKDKASNYMPNEYWDFTKSGKENAEAYLKMCAENNKRPKFYKLLDYDGKGTYSLKADGSTDGYWKLLIDFKMYDNDGNGSPQMPVRPDFSMGEIRKMLKEYEGGHDTYPTAHNVVDEFVNSFNAQKVAKSSSLITQPVNVGVSLGNTMFMDREVVDSEAYGQGIAKITTDTTESQRYEILKEKKITAPFYKGEADKIISINQKELESQKLGLVKSALVKIASEFDAFTDYNIKDVGVEIRLSKSNLKESVSKDATPVQLAKLLPLLKIAVEHAIGIESHRNRYYYDIDTVYFDNLLGAYIDGENLIPVRFGLKHSQNGSVVLYVVVDQNKIGLEHLSETKKDRGLQDSTPDKTGEGGLRRSVTYNITQIIPFVNSKDLLRYIPDKMLNQAQRSAKWEAIAETIIRTNSKNDRKYADYIAKGDLRSAKQMVSAAAKVAGYDTPKLYHGTNRFGFTRFDTGRGHGFIYGTTNPAVAANYGGNGNYAGARAIGKRYISPDTVEYWNDEIKSVIQNAESVFGTKYKVLSDDIRAKIRADVYNEVSKVASQLDDNFADFDLPEGIANSMTWVIDLFYTVQENDNEYFSEDADIKAWWLSSLKDSINHYNEHYPKLREYLDNHFDEFTEAQKNYVRVLQSFEALDAAIDIEYGYYKAANPTNEVQLVNAKTNQNIVTREELQSKVDSVKNVGAYELYGKIGNNPLRVDANGRDWVTLVVPEMGDNKYHSTDVVAEWAKANGYTSVIVTNVYDGGELADDYIFFDTNQVKSADPITYDDSDNVIPLSERFNSNNDDIRYQERTETPEPSEVLRELFETNAAFAGYKSYTASLKKYQELMQRVDGYEKQIADIDANIARLRSKRRQSGKGTRIGDLSDKRIAIEKKIEQAKNKMFAMEAKELNSVVRAETKRLVQDERTKARLRRYNARKQHYIESIGKRVKAMQEKLVKNSADHHIPDALKAPIAELLTALDFSSKRSLQGGAPTKKEADLKAAVDRITKLTSGINPEDIPPLDLPPRFKDQWDEVVRVVDAYTWGRGKLYPDKMILQEMDVASLRSLNRALMDIQHAVSVANETIAAANMAPINVLANDLYSYLKNDVKEAKVEGKGVWQAGKNFITWENTLPVYAFDRLGEVGQKLFATFQDGFDKLVTEVNQIIETTEKTYTQKEVQSWRKQVYNFKFDTINGESRTLYLTTPQIMSLYCLSKREQAKKHFAGGGIVAEDIRISVKGKYKNSAEGVRLTEQALERIIGKLTDRQKKVADELQTFMTNVCAEWGNEVTYKRWGIRPLTEENYFPIDTKSSTRDKESTSPQRNTQLYALLNMSFTKQINENANNQIIISDIFDVFADHSSSMARYHTLALPVLDFMKVYNYREKQYSNTSSTDKSFEEKNPRDALKDAFGTAGVKYIEDFLATINGANWTRDKDQLLTTLSKAAKTAMVGFNLRTVVQQPTSIVRALMYLDATDLVVSLNPMGVKKAKDLALKYCPMARWKSMGYFDIGTGRGMVNMIAKTPNWRDSAIEKSLYLAEKADEVTWAYLWKATEHWVSRHTKFTKGTDAYYNACGEKLREVIYRTQVVDSPLTKSQYMSSDSAYKKMVSMFAAEGTVTYNMIQAEVYALAKETKRDNRKKHALRIVKFTGIFAAQALFLAAVQSIPDAIRDDDDDEELGEKYITAFFENLLSELNPLNKLPIMRDIVSVLEGFTIERTDAIIWNKASKAIKAIIKAIMGDGNISVYNTIYTILAAASTATGIGVSNAIRDVVALWNTLMEEIDPSLKIE